METKQKTISYLASSIIILGLTSCGNNSGNSESSSSSCLNRIIDSDGDGFHDAIDPAPNDVNTPADLSSPEKILAHPKVKKALKIAKTHGLDISLQLGRNPPNLTGYYQKDIGTGRILATETGLDNNKWIYGVEQNICSKDLLYQEKGVDFVESGSEKYHYRLYNAYLRGSKKRFTYYGNHTYLSKKGDICYGVYIYSAKLDTNGNQVNAESVYTQIYGSSSCEAWELRKLDTFKKLNSLNSLTHMCIDEGKAYLLKERWKNKVGESCSCATGYETICQ